MPGKVETGLQRLEHKKPKQPIHASSKYTAPQYGLKKQVNKVDNSPPMTKEDRKTPKQVVGYFLYYSRATDPTMAHKLNVLATSITKGTKETMKNMEHFLKLLCNISRCKNQVSYKWHIIIDSIRCIIFLRTRR